MSDSSDPGASRESAVLRSVVMLSTLTTAGELWRAVRERRAGRDPSAQEADGVVRAWVPGARRELQEMAMRLRASLSYTRYHEQEHVEALVRRFDDLLTLRRLAGLLHTLHQRLLSLYPAVSEALAEDARLLQAESAALLDAEDDAFAGALPALLDRLQAFLEALRADVG